MPRTHNPAHLLVFTAALLVGMAAHAGMMEMSKETGRTTEHGNSVTIGAHSKEVLCPKGGVYVTAMDEHAVSIVSLYCLSDSQVDKMIASLEEAKVNAGKIRSMNQ